MALSEHRAGRDIGGLGLLVAAGPSRPYSRRQTLNEGLRVRALGTAPMWGCPIQPSYSGHLTRSVRATYHSVHVVASPCAS
jgi:hypothetical protein